MQPVLAARSAVFRVLVALLSALVVLSAAGPASATSVGPDAEGYRALDDDEVGGPTYSWVELEDAGTPHGLADDASFTMTMPFSTTLYDATSDSVRIGSNGYVQVAPTTGEASFFNGTLPTSVSSPTLFPYWDDLYGSTVYTHTIGDAPDRQFVIEWKSVSNRNGGRASFEVIITEGSSDILFQYADVIVDSSSTGAGTGSTIGITKDDTTGVQYSVDSPVVHDGLAIGFTTSTAITASPPATPALGSFPDADGYQVYTSDQVGGPAFAFTDISTTGSVYGVGDDDEVALTLPFDVTFYGTTSRDIAAGANGSIRFDATTGARNFFNSALPDVDMPLSLMPYWDDNGAGVIRTQLLGDYGARQYVIQWNNYDRGTGDPIVMQVVFNEGSDDILFLYDDAGSGGATATVGINKDDVVRNRYSFNEAALTDGLALLFTDENPFTAAAPAVDPSTLTDRFGYRSHLSTDADGPVFSWIDATTSPDSTTSLGDDAMTAVTAPFEVTP
jgi:hypothetical protein